MLKLPTCKDFFTEIWEQFHIHYWCYNSL